MEFKDTLAFAQELDQEDGLAHFRNQFHFPVQENGEPFIYFCGNSLGLQPKHAKSYVDEVMKNWQYMAIDGYFEGETPWLHYHTSLAKSMAKIVGARPSEVTVMNTLTVNLHLMMVSFYQPTAERYKILIESDAFPSDRYAVESQIKFHGYEVENALIEIRPRKGEECIRMEDVELLMKEHGHELALMMLGGLNYYTGQRFDLDRMTELGHSHGCKVGFDLAHAAGNVPLNLHNNGADFAVWCTYKYMNSGPGSIAAAFVHDRHAHSPDLPRFAGWWGHNVDTRFNMRDPFDPIPGAEGWQLSCMPYLSIAGIKASMELFDQVDIMSLRDKSVNITGYLAFLLNSLDHPRIKIITPSQPEERGCQLSMLVKDADKGLFDQILRAGIIVDWREPCVIRLAPVPFYNSYEDVFQFVKILSGILNVH